MNTKTVGDKTEAKVLAALLEVYPTVLIPFGDNQRYDFVFEDVDGSFLKVQCKTGRYRNGVIIFNAYSNTRKDGQTVATKYSGEVDYFGIVCPDFVEVYLVPIADVGNSSKGHLRVDPTKNGQDYGSKWAKDYVIYNPCS